jgi:hypothetical protein
MTDPDVCQPIRKPFPSGVAWAHSRSCPSFPGQKISADAPWHHEPERVCVYGNRACFPVTAVLLGLDVEPGLYHSLACPVSPGVRIDLKEYAKGRSWPPRGKVRG